MRDKCGNKIGLSIGEFPDAEPITGAEKILVLQGNRTVKVDVQDLGVAGPVGPVGPVGPSGIESQEPAVNQWGQAVGVVAGETATLASIPSSAAGYRIRGFTANGIGDGYFFIQINLVTVLSGRIRLAAPVYSLILPNGIVVATGSAVALKVTNESGSTADYEATLLGM